MSVQESPILTSYESEKEALVFYYLRSDGSKRLITSLELAKLKSMGLKTASSEIGEFILSSFQATGEALFE